MEISQRSGKATLKQLFLFDNTEVPVFTSGTTFLCTVLIMHEYFIKAYIRVLIGLIEAETHVDIGHNVIEWDRISN